MAGCLRITDDGIVAADCPGCMIPRGKSGTYDAAPTLPHATMLVCALKQQLKRGIVGCFESCSGILLQRNTHQISCLIKRRTSNLGAPSNPSTRDKISRLQPLALVASALALLNDITSRLSQVQLQKFMATTGSTRHSERGRGLPMMASLYNLRGNLSLNVSLCI